MTRGERQVMMGPAIAVMALMVPAGVALALPHDDAMAGSYRCAAIADSRQWLDCYYGAAQPVRALLHLPPATPQQLALAATPPAGGQPADVATRNAVMVSAARCTAAASERDWLDCFYDAAQIMRARLGLATTAKPAPLPAMSMPPASAPPLSRPFIAHMASYRFDRGGTFTVALDNGQTWRQLSGDTSFAHWSKPASSYRVSISRGFLGSYNLRVAGIGQGFKVERIDEVSR